MNSIEQTLAMRKKYLGLSLSLAYNEPLKIVRGKGQYLYDENGRKYLDCINNISHVGHCHPAVIQAAHEQNQLLNTNTRYLHDNVVAAVNFGAGLPRALVSHGAPVASVTDLNTYGLMNHVSELDQRNEALQAFKDMYSQAIGSGPVMDYLSQTGLDALKGAEIIGGVTDKYSSDVEYAENSFAKSMKGAAQILQADIGTRICYTQHGSFDAHTNGIALQEGLLTDVSGGIYDFYDDMKRANKSDDVIMFVFTEFGRRVKDNGNGTDHGSGGVAFVIGDQVDGGQYSEYPSLAADQLLEGDLRFNLDFRSVYTEILEDWLEIDASSVVKGEYEKVGFLKN